MKLCVARNYQFIEYLKIASFGAIQKAIGILP